MFGIFFCFQPLTASLVFIFLFKLPIFLPSGTSLSLRLPLVWLLLPRYLLPFLVFHLSLPVSNSYQQDLYLRLIHPSWSFRSFRSLTFHPSWTSSSLDMGESLSYTFCRTGFHSSWAWHFWFSLFPSWHERAFRHYNRVLPYVWWLDCFFFSADFTQVPSITTGSISILFLFIHFSWFIVTRFTV